MASDYDDRAGDSLSDPRFARVSEGLWSYASDEDDPPVVAAPGGDERARVAAAVALIVRGGPTALDILFIKRASAPGDPWSGHMAFPGGRRDPEDRSLLETAIRETREEVGADLATSARSLGRLSALEPSSPLLPPLHIQPFVFGAPGDFVAKPASREVAAVHWVAISRLRDPATHSTVSFTLNGVDRTFPCFQVVPGEVVWGLTYRIITELLETTGF